jgi:hypothetical protein
LRRLARLWFRSRGGRRSCARRPDRVLRTLEVRHQRARSVRDRRAYGPSAASAIAAAASPARTKHSISRTPGAARRDPGLRRVGMMDLMLAELSRPTSLTSRRQLFHARSGPRPSIVLLFYMGGRGG